jgi:hypothetical protein
MILAAFAAENLRSLSFHSALEMMPGAALFADFTSRISYVLLAKWA